MWPDAAETLHLGSVDRPGRHNPFAGLTGRRSDQIEVAVVVQNGQAAGLGGGGNEQIWQLAPALVLGCKQALPDQPGRPPGSGLRRLPQIDHLHKFAEGEDLRVACIERRIVALRGGYAEGVGIGETAAGLDVRRRRDERPVRLFDVRGGTDSVNQLRGPLQPMVALQPVERLPQVDR